MINRFKMIFFLMGLFVLQSNVVTTMETAEYGEFLKHLATGIANRIRGHEYGIPARGKFNEYVQYRCVTAYIVSRKLKGTPLAFMSKMAYSKYRGNKCVDSKLVELMDGVLREWDHDRGVRLRSLGWEIKDMLVAMPGSDELAAEGREYYSARIVILTPGTAAYRLHAEAERCLHSRKK